MDLGEFQLESPLGVGGMGSVWRGRHGPSGIPVALKFLKQVDAHQLASFQNEIRATAALDHPAIARIFDHGRTERSFVAENPEATVPEGSPWFAMELCSRGLVDLAREPSWEALHPLLLTLLDALGHAHARGVLHRDLKIANVMLATADDLRPGPKLVDFGIARLAEDATGEAERVGTPRLMAPEQLQGRDALLGPWTDLYGLGMMAWRIVTGRIPYKGYEGVDLFAQIFANTPEWSEARFAIPDGARGWIERCIARAPEDRFVYAADAAQALRELAPGQPSRASMREASALHLGAAGLALVGVRRPEMVGRRKARDRIRELVQQAQATQKPVGLVAEGAPGSGRGHLLDAAAEQAEREGAAHAVCMRFAPDVGVDSTVLAGLREHFGIFGDDPIDAEESVHFWTRNASIAEALGPPLAQLDATDRSWEAVAVAALQALARTRPVVLVLHDPPATATSLVRRLLHRDVPIVVLWAGGSLQADALEVALERLQLGPMPLSELRQLALALVPLTPEAARKVALSADGSPALLVDLLRHWAQSGWLVPHADGCRVDERAAPPASAAILAQTRVEAVLQGLDADGRAALEIAAALGPTVPRGLWLELAGPSLEPVAERLLARGLLSTAPGGYRFKQVAFLEAIRRTIADLPTRHAQVAAHLQEHGGSAEAIGSHLLRSGQRVEALGPLLASVIPVADRSGPEAALAVLDQIEQVARELPYERDRTWWSCAVADRRANFLKATDLAGAWTAANRARELVSQLRDHDLEALVHSRFGALAERDGDLRGVADGYARALATEDAVEPARLAYWHAERGRVLLRMGDQAGGRYHLRQAWRSALAEPDHALNWSEPLNAALYARAEGRLEEAVHHCDRLELRAITRGSLVGRFQAARTRAEVLRELGEHGDALRGFQDAVRFGRMLGYTHHIGVDSTRLVALALQLERSELATAAFDGVQDLLPPGADEHPMYGGLHRCAVAVETLRRDWARVRYHLDRCHPTEHEDPEAAALLAWAAAALREANQTALLHHVERLQRRSGSRRPRGATPPST